jgi:serine/threonine-protein kinase
LAQQTSQRLTFQSVDEVNPVWAADSKSIFYRCDALGPPDVFRWTLGEDHGNLVYRGPAIEQPEDVSPDGKSLLIVSYNRAVGHRVLVVPLDHPSETHAFSTAPFNDASPRFSPDGKFVAYESDASGRPEIYVRPFAGGALPARISSDGGTKPRWRADGTELFFLAPGGRLMSVPMRGGVAAGAPKMLFQANNLVDFESAANGSKFLAQIQERPLDPPVHLLVNWRARIENH